MNGEVSSWKQLLASDAWICCLDLLLASAAEREVNTVGNVSERNRRRRLVKGAVFAF
jgi:hypothetical protein